MTFFLFIVLWLVLLATAAVVVTLVLMQEGKGGSLTGSMGASMGETFGFGGATRQIKKFTAMAAGVFMLLCILVTLLSRQALVGSDDWGVEDTTPTIAPAPAPGADTLPAGVTVEGNVPVQSAPAAPVTSQE